jgi:hypothetical protein
MIFILGFVFFVFGNGLFWEIAGSIVMTIGALILIKQEREQGQQPVDIH